MVPDALPNADATIQVIADESPGPGFVPIESDALHVYRYALALTQH